MSQQEITPVIIDCDPGSDDAWAIISLLKCEERFGIKLKGITIANGNASVEKSSRNALLILKTFDRLDVPVFVGAESSLISKPGFYTNFHGKDGLSDVYDDKPAQDQVQSKHAVEALKDFIENVRFVFK